jgi:hypothetical protein
MSNNPYESPQTINEPLPVATEVHPFVRTREGLIRAAALCVEGGRIQFAAGLVGVLGVLLAMERADQYVDGQLGKLSLLLSIVVTTVLWIWGAIKNYLGYTGMARHVTNEGVQNFYVLCQIQWWVQFVVTLVLIFVPSGMNRDAHWLAGGVLSLLTLSHLAATVAQTKALQYWSAHLELPMATRTYLAGGVAVATCLGLEMLHVLLGWREPMALHVVLALLLAVTAWDYSQRYHTVHAALLEERDA